MKSIIGKLKLSKKQAVILGLRPYQRISPYLNECCLRASANVSYKNAAQDLERYTGMAVSGKTQQRLVHRYRFEEFECQSKVSEISVRTRSVPVVLRRSARMRCVARFV